MKFSMNIQIEEGVENRQIFQRSTYQFSILEEHNGLENMTAMWGRTVYSVSSNSSKIDSSMETSNHDKTDGTSNAGWYSAWPHLPGTSLVITLQTKIKCQNKRLSAKQNQNSPSKLHIAALNFKQSENDTTSFSLFFPQKERFLATSMISLLSANRIMSVAVVRSEMGLREYTSAVDMEYTIWYAVSFVM